MRRVAVLPVTGVHLEGVIERGQKPQRKKLWMKRSTIACDRLTPYAFVHRVFRFSSRKSLFFAKLFNALSFSFFVTSLQPWFFLLFFPFFNFLRKSIEIEKWMFVANTQTANSIGFFDKRRQNFFTFHDGFSTQVSRYTRTTYFSLSFSLFQVYMYVFLLSISFERKKNIGYKTNERIYNIDKKEENEEKGIYLSPNLVIKKELCNSYDTRFAWFCVIYDASWIELPWTFFSKSMRSLKERKGLIFWSRIFTHIAYLFYRLKWLNILTNSNELLAR